jgi:hypothetical protein
MRRLYFLLPDKDTTRTVVSELEDAGIPHSHLHAVASITQDLEDLPEAGVWQKTEMAHGLELGVGLGGMAGLLGGVLAVAFPPAGLILGGGALIATTVAGAGVGGVVSALMASHDHNHSLDSFQRAIERGEILLLVDVPKNRVDEIKALILQHHPEASIGIAKPS